MSRTSRWGSLGVPRSLHAVGKEGVSMTGTAVASSMELQELRRRPWTHIRGLLGHFSTESRRDSATLRGFRQARQDRRTRRLVAALRYPQGTQVDRHDEHRQRDDEDTILVLGECQYRRRRHSPRGGLDRRSIAHDPAECRRMARRTVNEEEK
jgi:hypothetical protein